MSNNTSHRGARARAAAIEGPASATPDHVATTVAAIEIATPPVGTPTPRPHPIPRNPAPVNMVINGKGAWVWKKVGDHQTETVWDPSAEPVTAQPLPLGPGLRGLMFRLAERHGLERLPFVTWCEANTALVRAADRRYRLDSGQLSAFDGIVAGYRETA